MGFDGDHSFRWPENDSVYPKKFEFRAYEILKVSSKNYFQAGL